MNEKTKFEQYLSNMDVRGNDYMTAQEEKDALLIIHKFELASREKEMLEGILKEIEVENNQWGEKGLAVSVLRTVIVSLRSKLTKLQ